MVQGKVIARYAKIEADTKMGENSMTVNLEKLPLPVKPGEEQLPA
jgi:hypothetical protein